MRAAGLLPLLLLLGVSSQDDADPANPGQTLTTKSTETTTVTTPASKSTSETPLTTTSPPTTLHTTATTTTQPSVVAATTTQSTISTTSPGTSSSSTTTSPTTVAGTTSTTPGTTLPATTTPSHTSGQDSSSHSTASPKTTPAASSTTSRQPSSATDSAGSLGTTAAAKPVVTNATSTPGAVGAVGTFSPTTKPPGKQPLDHLPNTTVSTTVLGTDPSQSSKECVVPPQQCATKQPPPSSSSPAPSTSPGSSNTSVTPPIGSPSLTTTPMSQPGSKDTVAAATTTTPGADQSTHDVGSAKPTSTSQSPASAQPPASGDETDQAESCSSGHQQPNISSQNELICKEQVQHTRPTIQLKEPRTCDEWEAAGENISFFESFCSTAQHVFDASRDRCTVMLTACKSPSHHWAVRVVLHLPLDSEEVLMKLKEKKERLEELGIVNITSDKMVEDMTINDEFSTPLIITIITLAGSLLLVAAIYGCHQRFSQKKDQNIHPDVPGFDDGHVALIFNQRLTEEMQTMENGYHDNPTLEVMETSSEMQEKKVNLNGELGDSWIVPLDTLMKEDLEEEEDTHL
ncbi:podocalyxin isoform X1 [Vidua chalybeata]|uniref:podocalyxin isoform X1 n=1 Tax=Vidua chalybeata TaxID=81927 RepID=UPI0023A7F8BF|nr:podocalyxin isoform X1 [Vidua chalybeata]